jgi:outer membrane murein-binding lipoprotein Lpp
MNNPGSRQEVAGASANVLLTRLSFWRREKAFLIIIGFSAASLYILAPYTYEFAQGWVFLTISVQLLALWGAFISAKSLARLEVETAIACEIELRGAEYLRSIKSKQRERIDLNRLEETIPPNNPSNPPPAMIRLFQHICKEAKDRKFESSVTLTQPYREEPLEDIFRLQNLQKIALWLGILGTFIGLLLALQAGDMNTSHSSEALLGIIKSMFDDLFISFSASLAGLEVAVILGFFLLLLRKRQESYFKLMESAAVTMLSLARNSINKDDFITEFNQINTTVSNLSNKVGEQTRDLSNSILSVQSQIREQTVQIQAGINKLSQTGLQFDGFLQQVSDTQKQFIDDVRDVYNAISLKGLGALLQESVLQTGKHITGTLSANVNQISTQLIKFNNSVDTLSKSLQGMSRESAETAKMLENQIKLSITENSNLMKSLAKQMQESIKRETGVSSSLKSDLQDLSRKIEDLSRSVDRIRYFVPSERRSLWEYIKSFRL